MQPPGISPRLVTMKPNHLLSNVHPVTYADDFVVIVITNSRLYLQNTIQQYLDNTMVRWIFDQKLQISATKLELIVNKIPPRVHNRDFNWRLYGQRLKMKVTFTFSGIVIQPKLNFALHVNQTCSKSKKLTWALTNTAQSSWNVDTIF